MTSIEGLPPKDALSQLAAMVSQGVHELGRSMESDAIRRNKENYRLIHELLTAVNTFDPLPHVVAEPMGRWRAHVADMPIGVEDQAWFAGLSPERWRVWLVRHEDG